MDAPDAPPPFDRAGHLRQDLDYLEAQLSARETLLLPVHGDRHLLVARDQRLEVFMPTVAQAGGLLELDGELVWLGQLDGRACFAVDVGELTAPADDPAIPDDIESQDLRFVLTRLDEWQARLAAYGAGMLTWHRRHRHCGRCGAPTRPRRGGHLRVCSDAACRAEVFPRIDPAILVLVQHGDRFLLGRQASWPRGMYSALAGFVEPGESLEETVAREVAEEAGIRVHDIRYRASQPWPFPSSLMLGFTAQAASDRIELLDKELEDAAWFTREELRHPTRPGFFTPPPQSLAGQLLARFALGQTAPAAQDEEGRGP